MLVKTQFVEFEIQFVYSWVLVLALCLVVGKIKGEENFESIVFCGLVQGKWKMNSSMLDSVRVSRCWAGNLSF